jgi:GT2 family glycosyltransferase
VFPGDVLAHDAIEILSDSIAPNGVVYADNDVLAPDGTYVSPELKPDYSPDLLLSRSYIGAPLVMGSAVANRLAHPVGTSAVTIEHEFALAACETATSVHHIAEVLCHRSPRHTADLRGPASIEHVRVALERRGEAAEVRSGSAPGTFHILRTTNRSVSIVIPFRDEPQLLRTCVDSVTATTKGTEIEFLLVDNGSTDLEMATLLEKFELRADVSIMSDPRPFNWAALNNAAASIARGEVLLFLNNDIEAIDAGWLTALVGHAARPDVAAAGARLLYPDRRLQHCGVVLGLIGAAGHPLVGLEPGESGYLQMASVTRECSAVTGACLATRREVYDSLHGFDETLGVDLNDIDYCLRGYVAGYRTIFEPGAELIHHESPSRGTAGGASDILEFVQRWQDAISTGDPYLNRHITRSNASCGLASGEEKERWHQWYSTLGSQ